MYADTNFAKLCPGVDLDVWCLNPPSNGTCCGICPASGISGLGGHISLAFSSLSSIAAIALSPSSAPSALVTNLIQADAYAVSLLGYLLTQSSDGSSQLDFFHAAYALLLALSSLIPLTAIAASPPWAVTGQKSPQERSADAQAMVLGVMQDLEVARSDDDDDESDRRSLLRHRRRSNHARLEKVLENDPDLLVRLLSKGPRPPCGIPGSHWMLYIGFSFSVVLWGSALFLGVLGGATGSTRVALTQPNCTSGLGSVASLILYTDIGFSLLAIVVFIATILNHLVKDVANALDRDSIMEYNGSPRLVFGVSFVVWVVWMLASFSLYFSAGNANLLAAAEFSWSFGTMISVPVYSVISALWANR
ncbi:hypothetical protein JCM1840_001778 [Sporobolomyces johnsonii]